jgi:hypothetical protein
MKGIYYISDHEIPLAIGNRLLNNITVQYSYIKFSITIHGYQFMDYNYKDKQKL